MNGNLKGWFVVFPIRIFTATDKLSLDHERFVSISIFLVLHICISLFFLLFRFGTFSVDHALNAGVDLEIPGVNKWRTVEHVKRTIMARKVTAATVKQRAKKVLELVQKCAQRAPEVNIHSNFILTSSI